jgi:hypothetical protein
LNLGPNLLSIKSQPEMGDRIKSYVRISVSSSNLTHTKTVWPQKIFI